MSGPGWAIAAKGAGKLAGGIADWYGGDMAANALKRAQGNARSDLTQGYQQAKGFQQPIYDKALGNYSNLSDAYGRGDFKNPEMTAFSWDPNQVFQDPEYQAGIRAGTEAINSGANARSMLFSGQNNKDLMQFGQDLFSQRSDALYNRANNARNMAFDQNARSNLTDFNMGQSLAQPLAGAANNLSNLSVDQGTAMADNSLGSGQIRAGNILRTSGAIGGTLSDLADMGADYAMLGKGNAINKPKVRL